MEELLKSRKGSLAMLTRGRSKIWMYAQGMTVRESKRFLKEQYKVEVSSDLTRGIDKSAAIANILRGALEPSVRRASRALHHSRQIRGCPNWIRDDSVQESEKRLPSFLHI
jgi:hypothetical protein